MSNKDKVTRQAFFKDYILDLLGGIDEAFGAELSDFAESFPELVRPPGACHEKEFIEKCLRCGACVKACPFFALTPVLQANVFDRGTPTLRVGQAYCRFCENFPCINACTSGALDLTNLSGQQRIATARIIAENCLRSNGTDCTECVKKCQSIAVAICLPESSKIPEISQEKCSGCGACAAVCPAYPDPAINLSTK